MANSQVITWSLRVLKQAAGELTGDGTPDAAVVLYENTGGSGGFRQLCAVVNENGALKHVSTASLGDRIKVETVSIKDSEITVNDLDRKPENSYAVKSYVKMTREFCLVNNKLVQQ